MGAVIRRSSAIVRDRASGLVAWLPKEKDGDGGPFSTPEKYVAAALPLAGPKVGEAGSRRNSRVALRCGRPAGVRPWNPQGEWLRRGDPSSGGGAHLNCIYWPRRPISPYLPTSF